MEKVFLKPTSQEIIIKGNAKEGHTDVFAYDYRDDDDKRKLGGLFLVGNVRQDDTAIERENAPDIAYVINLVASLAKREYYSRSDAPPREAFAATLKKINDVVEEFFKNKSLKVNIGIFAIAGEQMFLSKLGKFKIILGRPARAGGESRTVDILNNIDLFKKEQVEEKEFSNIISGKIMPGDRLFAFYPSRLVTAREKFIKASLLKFKGEQFVEKIHSIKEMKPDFDCGALYLSLDTHKEPAVAKKVKLIVPDKNEPAVNLAKIDLKNISPAGKEKKDQSPANIKPEEQSRHQDTAALAETSEEVPRIISSEFSLGRKTNPLLAPVKILKSLYGSGVYIGSLASNKLPQKINLRRKFVLLCLTVGILAIGVIAVKKFVVINPEQRQLNAILTQTRNNLKLAKTKVGQNDFIGARQLLTDSLSGIFAANTMNDRTKKATGEIYEILDDIDKAVEISPSLLETMPSGLNTEKPDINQYGIASPLAFSVYENNLYILTSDSILKVADVDQTGKKEPVQWLKSGTLPSESSKIAIDGNIYVMNNSGTLATYYKGEKVSEANTLVISKKDDILLTSKNSDKLYLANKTLARIYELDKKSGSLIKTVKIGSSEPFTDAYLYGDSTIIIFAKDGRIWELK